MESDTPRSATVSNQRMNTLASLHLRDIDVMVYVGGGQESPRESKGPCQCEACGWITNYQLWTTQKTGTIPHPSMKKNYASGITNNRNTLNV